MTAKSQQSRAELLGFIPIHPSRNPHQAALCCSHTRLHTQEVCQILAGVS